MKRISRSICPAVVTIAAALFCMAVLFVCPSVLKAAQTGTAAAKPAAKPASESERIDARINAFHDKLKITDAQQDQWNKLADVMRENAKTMTDLVKARKAKEGAMNAVDDLKSYNEIVDAQADGLHKFIEAFEPLYAAMSDEQKKNADAIFTRHFQKKLKK